MLFVQAIESQGDEVGKKTPNLSCVTLNNEMAFYFPEW